MVCKSGNEILRPAIYQIVHNVQIKYYGNDCLDPTGPGLLSKYFSREHKNTMDLKHEYILTCNYRFILLNGYYVFQSYPGYIDEHNMNKKVNHYSSLWTEKKIYS